MDAKATEALWEELIDASDAWTYHVDKCGNGCAAWMDADDAATIMTECGDGQRYVTRIADVEKQLGIRTNLTK
jgi:hypothetical protein